jgi:beta-lactamase regulating signal transducer with metallopeptidase domain
MNEFADVFLFRMGQASAFLAVAAVIAWSILHALRCQSPFVHRTVWCLVLAQSLLIFQFPIAIPWKTERSIASALGETNITRESSVLMDVAAPNQANSAELQAGEIPQWTVMTYWPSIVFVVWFAGVLAILGRCSMRYVWFVRNLPCRKCENDSWNQEWDVVQAERGTATRIPLYVSDLAGPMLCRWPDGQRVVVPKTLWSRLPREQRQAILCHELAHFERNDLLKTLIANLVAAVHWFNPLAWFAVRRFEDSIEWTCDRIVLASKPEANVHYAKALLSLGSISSVSTTWASAVFGGGLAARIRRVVSADNASDSRTKVLVTLGILIGLSAAHVVRVELVAQEAKEQPKNVIAKDYFIAPVVTELQKELHKRKSESVSVYASINGRSFFNKQRPELNMNRFDFDSFIRDLSSTRKASEKGSIETIIDFETINNESLNELARKVEDSFKLKLSEAGIEKVGIILSFTSDERDWWKIAEEPTSNQQEPKLGNERVSVFPVRTALSKILMRRTSVPNGFDCFINLSTVLQQNAKDAFTIEDKEVIRKAVSELRLPKGSSALLVVHFENPRNGKEIKEQFAQIKKDSEFQRNAVDYLKTLGFARVGTSVDVSSVWFLDMHH